MENIGIIIQARTGSTRLPGKVLLPFFKDKSILSIIINKAKETNIPTVVATSNNTKDNQIVSLCKKMQIPCFTGSEENVLDRFIETAKAHNFTTVIRICADNPFIEVKYINELVQHFQNSNSDYCSFSFDNKIPVIKNHIGIFSEITTLEVLEKVKNTTSTRLYTEHVTNFIYETPDHFKTQLIPVPKYLINRSDLRFTIDSSADFELMKEIYLWKTNNNKDFQDVVKYIDSNPVYYEQMQEQINANSK